MTRSNLAINRACGDPEHLRSHLLVALCEFQGLGDDESFDLFEGSAHRDGDMVAWLILVFDHLCGEVIGVEQLHISPRGNNRHPPLPEQCTTPPPRRNQLTFNTLALLRLPLMIH